MNYQNDDYSKEERMYDNGIENADSISRLWSRLLTLIKKLEEQGIQTKDPPTKEELERQEEENKRRLQIDDLKSPFGEWGREIE